MKIAVVESLEFVMKLTLERFSHIAVIVACLAVTAQVGGGIYRSWHLDDEIRAMTKARSGAYPPGSTISEKANLGISKSQKTLILVTTANAAFAAPACNSTGNWPLLQEVHQRGSWL
jgi:hypothetical protein